MRGVHAAAPDLPESHLTLPRPRRGPLPLPRRAAERGSITGVALFAMLSMASGAFAAAVEAEHGMVVSAHRLGSEVGVRVLQAGGNAVDAAVAVGYALAVVDPCCGNIGGGGFMTVHLADGRETFINFRETAPMAATATMYLDAEGRQIDDLSRHGYRAAAVPGTVLGLDYAAAKYGRLPRAAADRAGDCAGARRLCVEPRRHRHSRCEGGPVRHRTPELRKFFCGRTAAISSPAIASCRATSQPPSS